MSSYHQAWGLVPQYRTRSPIWQLSICQHLLAMVHRRLVYLEANLHLWGTGAEFFPFPGSLIRGRGLRGPQDPPGHDRFFLWDAKIFSVDASHGRRLPYGGGL